MFGSSILEVAIGLIFVYLLLSLVCSALNEMIESFLKNRATDLERGIRELFNQSDDLVVDFYKHPLINSLFQGTYKGDSNSKKGASKSKTGFLDYLKPTNLPSYIPARNFAYAVLDLTLHPQAGAAVSPDNSSKAQPDATAAVNAPAIPASMEAVRSAIGTNMGHSQVGRALRTLAEQSGNDLNAMRENVEAWFNSAMDRVSGDYKRRTHWIIFTLGFVLTILLNVNTITIVHRLSTDTTLRSIVVAEAEAYATKPDALKPDFEANRKQLEGLGLPLGWPNGFVFLPKPFKLWDHLLFPFIGWLLTAGAISLGAPFWFDLLNKFMVIRATVKPHEKSLEEGSEDRQQSPGPSTTVVATPTPGSGAGSQG